MRLLTFCIVVTFAAFVATASDKVNFWPEDTSAWFFGLAVPEHCLLLRDGVNVVASVRNLTFPTKSLDLLGYETFPDYSDLMNQINSALVRHNTAAYNLGLPELDKTAGNITSKALMKQFTIGANYFTQFKKYAELAYGYSTSINKTETKKKHIEKLLITTFDTLFKSFYNWHQVLFKWIPALEERGISTENVTEQVELVQKWNFNVVREDLYRRIFVERP